jgi:hypothetical protein
VLSIRWLLRSVAVAGVHRWWPRRQLILALGFAALASSAASPAEAQATPSPTGTWSLSDEFDNVPESSPYRHGYDNVTFTPTAPNVYTITVASASGGGTSNVNISGESFTFWECSASAGGAIYSELDRGACPETSGHYDESWTFDYSTSPYTATGTFQAYAANGATAGEQYGTFTAVGPRLATATVSGRIVTPQGDGEAGIPVELSGTERASTTTDSEGNYSFTVIAGEYNVRPIPASAEAADEFTPEHCDGTAVEHQCEHIKVEDEQQVVANFSAGFTLSGAVVGATGAGVSGATVNIQDKEQGTTKSLTATTNTSGKFETRLAPGSVTATVETLAGAEYFPVPSANCKVSSHGCVIELNQDRGIEFSSCVVPNPNGEPLPAGTPEPIPGAQTVGNLEAVGCWAPQPDGTFTSTKPVRLNGVDVNPAAGTTIVLNPDATVTSTGPASIGPGQLFAIPVSSVDLSFQVPQMQAADLGTGSPTFGIPMSIKGVPFSLTTGGTLQTLDPPWVSASGKTSITLNLQFPTTLSATSWEVEKGGFFNGPTQIPSIGGAVTLSVTNREGLIAPEVCAKLTGGELKLWNLSSNLGGITQATACYDFHAGQWALTGLFQLPESVKAFNRVYIKVGWLTGWNWNEGQIEVDGIQKMLADGVFLQRIGAKVHREFSPGEPPVSSFGLTAGLSFGPQLNSKLAGPLIRKFPYLEGAELLTLDGEGVMQVSKSPYSIKLNGNILVLRSTPLQAVIAGGNIAFNTNGRFDLGGQLSLVVPFWHWGINGLVNGFWDTEHGVLQLTGTATLTGPWHTTAKAQVLLNNGAVAVCEAAGAGGASSFTAGLIYNIYTNTVSAFAPGTCGIGAYTLPAPEPPAAGASSARARGSRHVLHLPGHLSGTTIAVHGTGAPPLVALHGPGLSVTTPAGEGDLANSRVFLVKDPSSDTTYVTLYNPRGGAWTITSLPGSARVTSVRAALPAPRAKLTARVGGPQCKRTLSYAARIPGGESVALYAQNGSTRTFLGDAHKHGRLSFSPELVGGRGEIIALETRGQVPRSVRTIAKYATPALTRPEAVTGLHLHGRVLSWTASCDAVKYTITVHSSKRTLDLASTSPAVELPALHGSYTITVTALAADGTSGPPLARKLSIR